MACVRWPTRDQFIPSSLKRVSFDDIAVNLDTSKHYIQGQVLIKYAVHKNAKCRFLKLVLAEDLTNVKLCLYVINEACDECLNVNVGDLMTLTGFKVEMETKPMPEEYHHCHIIAMPNNPSSLSIWVQVRAQSAVGDSSDADMEAAAVEHLARGVQKSAANSQHSSRNIARVSESQSVVHSSSGSRKPTNETGDKLPSSSGSHANVQSSTTSTRTTETLASSNNDLSPTKQTKRPSTPYVYTAIKDLKHGTSVNVFGIIKFVRPASRSRGLDCSMLLSIVDESLTNPLDRLKCMLFARDIQTLPDANVGDVIRFHRLKISSFRNELQGQNGPGCSWLLFDNSHDALALPRSTSTNNFTLTDDDKARVTDLINWASSDNSLLSQDLPASAADKFFTLSSVTVNMYFNLVCQVVAVCVLTEGKSLLLRVWDGTKITIPTYEQNMTEEPDLINRLVADNSLVRLSHGYVVDLWVYDDHFATAKSIKPGDYLSMTNVHAMVHKWTDADPVDHGVPMVELCIHGGGSEKYGRGLSVIDDSLPAVQRLKLLLDECTDDDDHGGPEEESGNSEYMTAVAEHATMDVIVDVHSPYDGTSSDRPVVVDTIDVRDLASGCLKRSSHNNKSTVKKKKTGVESSSSTVDTGSQLAENTEAILVSSSSASGDSQSAGSSSVENRQDRCLLNTFTVVSNDHRDIKHTCLRDVLARDPPYKFRVCATVIKYVPRAEHPIDIIQLFCPECGFLSPVPSDVSDVDDDIIVSNSLAVHLHHDDNGVSLYTCPHCCPSTRPASRQSVVCLTYIYMLEFVLDDGTGWLSAGLWKEEAVKFFNGVQPTELIRNRAKFCQVQRQLNEMCSRPAQATAGQRRMECCLMSYTTACGKAFQIFDTELSLA